MAKRNGGIIGPSNVPTGQYGGTASGVWRLRDAFNYIKAGLWPGFATYPVANSLRFNSASSDYLSRTPASATNQKTFTISAWVKLSSLTDGAIFNAYISGTQVTTFFFYGNQLWFYHYDGSFLISVRSTQLFRDVSAWYHVMASLDTTQATASNRVKLYVNGSQITDLSASTYGSQNQDTFINSTVSHTIGRESPSQSYIGGYVSEFNFIDGQQLTPSSFGQTDSATGIWTPLPYTGSFGTNGFYLKFANSAALGTDSSGNANTFTANNLTSVDQSTDTCTNNFATMNSTIPSPNITYSQGNLAAINNVDADYRTFRSTIAVSSGKWYAEFKAVSGFDNIDMAVGVVNIDTAYSPTSNISAFVDGFSYGANGGVREYNSSTVDTEATYTTGDIIGVALDLTNNKLYFSKNGTFINSADPAAGTNGYSITSGKTYCFTGSTILYAGLANLWNANFGSPPFTISSGNADANGYGNFEYAVPSGFYALNTKNLADYG